MGCPFKVYMSSTSYRWWNIVSYFWKNTITKMCQEEIDPSIEMFDPLVVKTEDPEICLEDIKQIASSDMVVVYLDKVTIGTMFELAFCAFFDRKKWCVLSFNQKVLKHPWIVKLCGEHLYHTFSDCVEYIKMCYIEKNTGQGDVKQKEEPKTKTERRFGG